MLEVIGAEGHDRRVEILSLLLQACHVTGQDRALPFGEPLQLAQIDGQLGRQSGLAHALDFFGQELIDRNAVEGRDLMQAGDRDIAIAALVGGEQ